MLKTFFLDGDKGGVGKSLTARLLLHYYITLPDSERPSVYLIDSDRSNPDLAGKGGYVADSELGLEMVDLLDLSEENGWIDFVNRFGALAGEDGEHRIIVNLPAQIGTRAFSGELAIVKEAMRALSGIPVWLLSRTLESVRALEARHIALPHRYERGIAVRNLFFGRETQFVLWERSDLRKTLCGSGWVETTLPEFNDEVLVEIGRSPLHTVIPSEGTKVLGLGSDMSLRASISRAMASMKVIADYAPEGEGAAEGGD